MSDTTTPNYGFDLPTVGASQDTWGNKLNANWVSADSVIHALATGYLPLTGGAIYGLTIAPPSGYAELILNKPHGTAAEGNVVAGETAGNIRWLVYLGTPEAETGGNAGSNFAVARYDDSGNYIDEPLTINRATGVVSVTTASMAYVTATNGHILSAGAGGSNPAVAAHNTSTNFAAGIWVSNALDQLQFGACDNLGTPSVNYGFLSATSIGFYGNTVSITVNGGANAICYGDSGNFTIPGQGWKPGGGAWADNSDARIKTVLGDYEAGLDAILALRPVRYRFKDNWTRQDNAQIPYRGDDNTYIGLIAQEAEVVMPEMVGKVPAEIDGQPVDDLRTLDLTALPLALVNAIKELEARVANLELLRLG